jgi:transposase
MISLSPSSQVFLFLRPADFRNGIDGLCAICKQELKKDPFSGALFVFTNKRKVSIKVLVYDGQGFWVHQKRMSEGKFKWWPKSNEISVPILARELMVLLWNGEPEKINMSPDWKKLERK